MDSRKIIVKAKKVLATRIRCFVNGRPITVSTSNDISSIVEAEKVVKKSFGPGAKNLVVTEISLEKIF